MMSNSVVDSLVGLSTPQIVDSLAWRLDEPEGAVRKGLQGGSAAMLDAIACRATDSGFLERIFALVKSPANDLTPSSLETARLNPTAVGLGTKFMSQVFGSQQSNLTDIVARASGLRPSSAVSIMGMAAPLVLGMLRERAHDENLTASSLGKVLRAETPDIKRFLPAGLGGLLGRIPARASAAAPPAKNATRNFAIRLLWLLPVLLLAALFWLLTTAKQGNTGSAQDPAAQEAQIAARTDLGEFAERTLPNGMTLKIPWRGMENKLIDFIEDPAKSPDKTTWFDFDRLLFDSGKSTFRNSSQEQIDNIANILRAYPNVDVKIGGYTDNTGDKALNLKLSQERATAVMNALIQAGVNKDRVSAQGYGEEHATGANAADEGRAKNRRISLRVTAK